MVTIDLLVMMDKMNMLDLVSMLDFVSMVDMMSMVDIVSMVDMGGGHGGHGGLEMTGGQLTRCLGSSIFRLRPGTCPSFSPHKL